MIVSNGHRAWRVLHEGERDIHGGFEVQGVRNELLVARVFRKIYPAYFHAPSVGLGQLEHGGEVGTLGIFVAHLSDSFLCFQATGGPPSVKAT
ncbi:hypothetical protein [Hydrogenophaga laconesensis]|uniref:Uncharacterized protein n=1 Tax=Hydrogenophaga laconesensis TaxID=1805971 RepID=A0ABU1VGE0_9BURK|nr:hypothetical protein [Hydrogenophaga laconesensis]MDR7096534.1 hypothetical protein [Hydrogenophaga laconesensis]